MAPIAEGEDHDLPLEEALAACIQSLEPHKASIARLNGSDGHSELFIGLFACRNFGFELPSSLLTSLANLGLAISFDIYPDAPEKISAGEV